MPVSGYPKPAFFEIFLSASVWNEKAVRIYLCKDIPCAYLLLENRTAYPLHPRTGKRLSVCVASRTKSTDMRVAPAYRNDPAGYNGTPVTRGPATMKAGR